jgi:hypothetical protein
MMKSLKTDAVSISPVIGRADSVAGVHQLTGYLDGLVQENREDIRASLRNFRQATVSADKLMDQLNGVVAENRRPICQLTEGSLPDLSALITDTRTAAGKATTILDSIEPYWLYFRQHDGAGDPAQMSRRQPFAGMIMVSLFPAIWACGLGRGRRRSNTPWRR